MQKNMKLTSWKTKIRNMVLGLHLEKSLCASSEREKERMRVNGEKNWNEKCGVK